ncbi:MAG: hypothetical protein M3527_04145, partial [Actinomycetota bacterium]|nr:hypothetical protein [Actinomycetota bacterium]
IMAEQFHLRFAGADAAAAAADRIRAVRLDEAPAFEVREQGDDLLVGCLQFQPVRRGAALAVDGREVAFHDLLYWVEAPRAGTHHPDGILWVRQPGVAPADGGRVPVTAVAPTLLALLGIPAPPTMREPALVASTA